MWFLPTRGRPKLCQDTLDACESMKMTWPGIVYVDVRRGDYPDLRLPPNWTKVLGDKDLAPAKQEFYEQHPDVSFYGSLFDDLIPRTQYFDEEYADAAEDWYMVDCNDAWPMKSGGKPVGYTRRKEHFSNGLPVPLSGAYGWGAKLVHTVGWWSLPDVQQFGTDNAWTYMLHIVHDLGLRKYLSDVVIEHKNWRTGKRSKDETDNWVREGKNYRNPDLLVFEQTRNNGTFNRLAERVREIYKLDKEKADVVSS